MSDRNYSESTKGALFALSVTCYEPDCRQPTVKLFGDIPQKNADIAHIRALKADGPRYNPPGYPTMTTLQRNAFTNLILLCKRHHQLIDNKANEALYTVKLLHSWKASAEKDIRTKVDGLDNLTVELLNSMLQAAAKDANREVEFAIKQLGAASKEAAAIVASLFEALKSRYLDTEAINTLDAATHRLAGIEEHAMMLYSASVRLEEFMGHGWSTLSELDVDRLVDVAVRLEQSASDHSGLVQHMPDLSSLFHRLSEATEEIDQAGDTAARRISQAAAKIEPVVHTRTRSSTPTRDSAPSTRKVPFWELLKIASVGGVVTLVLALAIAAILAANQVI